MEYCKSFSNFEHIQEFLPIFGSLKKSATHDLRRFKLIHEVIAREGSRIKLLLNLIITP